MKRSLALVALLIMVGCIPVPPIVIVPPQPAPPFVPPPPVVEPPVVVEPPAPPQEPEPPTVNLNVWVLTAASNPIVGAKVKLGSDERITDGGGFVNFGVKGQVTVEVSAKDYAGQTVSLPPGDHRVHLVSTLPPPPVVVPPPSATPESACSVANNSGRVSQECLETVARLSPEQYEACRSGSALACHRIVRKVVVALRKAWNHTDLSWGWGLLTKGGGEQGCNAEECDGGLGPDGKFAEDVITYLLPGSSVREWTGVDVVGGIGAPGARFMGGPLGPANERPTNKWGLP